MKLDQDEVKLLFIKRRVNPKDTWSGQMAFPGGRQDPFETDMETAYRETMEEVGIDLKNTARCIGQLRERKAASTLVVSSFGEFIRKKLYQRMIVFVLKQNVKLHLDKKEVADATWMDVHAMCNSPRLKKLSLQTIHFAPRIQKSQWLMVRKGWIYLLMRIEIDAHTSIGHAGVSVHSFA